MHVAIAGGHGRIGLMLGRRLAERGAVVRGLIRNPDHAADLREAGVEPLLCDLEQADALTVAEAVRGVEAIVFAAGAGPGSGAERKRTMDLGGAVKLIEAARAESIPRYVMVSAMGAADPPADSGDVFAEYLRAKAEADRALAASGLDFTIVRPGGLTDDPGTGRVAIGESLEPGEVPRADVAAVLEAVLGAPNAVGKTFDLTAGETPIEVAVAEL
ncbi:MAG: SDR family oxidoreductase [Solirubrobacterales bacterium]